MRIGILGGWRLEHDGAPLEVSGAMQRALLFRLALDPGVHLGYRAIAEDVWPDDPPENAKASLQSLVSRLRQLLPDGVVTSTPGGYRLEVARHDVDAIQFQDLVARAAAAVTPEAAVVHAREALALWAGEPWTPGDGYDWVTRDLDKDHRAAFALVQAATPTANLATNAGNGAEPLAEPLAEPIPAPLSQIIGRSAELALLAEQLDRSRLVTILGPGGAGKTRLAVEVARDRPRSVLVELAPASPDELWQAVLGALGREVRSSSDAGVALLGARDRVIAALSGVDALLVLDNCEHLIDAAASASHELLAALPRLRILTTSREPLGLPGEAFVPLGPLTPDAAARLFDERVAAARGTGITADEEVDATRIRRRLDGLPLALELAAAKARTMTIAEIAAGLDDRFALLSGGLRAVLPRHQTLRALVDWSWSLLDEGERAMLQAVSIYPGGIAAVDAAAVAAAHGGTGSQLDALVDKSLVQRAGGRYRALETIREYGLEKLAAGGGLPDARSIQARWLADAVHVQDALLRGPRIHDALEWFDAEDDNLASALRFVVETRSDVAARLAAGVTWYWIIRDRNEESIVWLNAVVPFATGDDEDSVFVRTVAFIVQSFSGFGDGVTVDVTLPLEELRAVSRDTKNELLQLLPLLVQAFSAIISDSNWSATITIPDDDPGLLPWSRAMLATMRAAMAQNQGDVVGLGAASELAVELFSDIGDLWGMALAKQMRSEWFALNGRYADALRTTDESTEALRRITSSWDLQQQQGLAVNMLVRLGRIDEALERAQTLLDEAEESGSARAMTLATATRGLLALQLGDIDTARAMFAEPEASDNGWLEVPRQLNALTALGRAGVALGTGDTVTAEAELREAAEHAAASHDHPVMSAVALGIGHLAVERGFFDDARQALELAQTLRGVPDPDDPTERLVGNAIEAALPVAVDQGSAASDAEGAESVAELTQILRR